jgi:hypothetical protein
MPGWCLGWCVSSLTDRLAECDSAAPDRSPDGICCGGPDGLIVVNLHVLLDRGQQVGHAVEYPSVMALSVSSRNHRSTRFLLEDGKATIGQGKTARVGEVVTLSPWDAEVLEGGKLTGDLEAFGDDGGADFGGEGDQGCG